MARIVIVSSSGERTLDLEPGQTLTVGRDAANRLAFPDEGGLSRRHCRIGPREGGEPGWEVADLGSTNKTRVNGTVVQTRTLADGDVIEIGSVRIRFEDPEEARRMEELGREGVCYLEWVSGPHKGERVMLTKKRTTIGRRETNVLPLEDRMVSGHHAEIDRDLNGYTIRDLGSTNGTLVNGEPVSEALLTHGARIRIGNARFAFKDPSMKDVEVELAHFEEDEGWGMMGEIDLSRARGSKVGLLVVLLLFLAAAGGGYLLAQKANGGPTVAAVSSGTVENGTFESDDLVWTPDLEDAVSLQIKARGGHPGSWLSLYNSSETDTARVTLDQSFEAIPSLPLRVHAAVKGGGKGAAFVVVWSTRSTSHAIPGGGAAPEAAGPVFERSDRIADASGGWSAVDGVWVPPLWARSARLAVVLPPGSDAGLDSVAVEIEHEQHAAKTLEVKSFKTASVCPRGSLDLVGSSGVLLSHAIPVARTPSGEVLARFEPAGEVQADEGTVVVKGVLRGQEAQAPAQITWATTQDGLEAEVTAEGVAAVGLEVQAPASLVGPTVTVLGDFVPQRIPANAGETLDSVSRALVGDPNLVGPGGGSMVAFVEPDEKPVAALEFVAGIDADVVVLRHWWKGTQGSCEIITDFTRQRRAAEGELKSIKNLAAQDPGQAIRAFRDFAQKYPFEEQLAHSATAEADQLETQARHDLDALQDALDRYRVFESPEALEKAETIASRLQAQFLAGDRTGPIESEIASAVKTVDTERQAYEVAAAEPGVDRLERLVKLLSLTQGFQPMAALYARAMLRRYEHLAPESPDLAQRLAAARGELEKLTQNEQVKEALPPLPEQH